MGRKKLVLGVPRKPNFAESWVIRRKSDGVLFRASALCSDSHAERRGCADQMPGRDFQCENPFFKMRYRFMGEKNFNYLTFLCGPGIQHVESDNGEFEWTDIKLKEARKQGLEIFNEHGIRAKIRELEETSDTDANEEAPEASESSVEETDNSEEDLSFETVVPERETVVAESVHDTVREMKECGFAEVAERPKRKTRRTVYRIVDGKVVSQRTRKQDLPEGYFESKEEAEATLV